MIILDYFTLCYRFLFIFWFFRTTRSPRYPRGDERLFHDLFICFIFLSLYAFGLSLYDFIFWFRFLLLSVLKHFFIRHLRIRVLAFCVLPNFEIIENNISIKLNFLLFVINIVPNYFGFRWIYFS